MEIDSPRGSPSTRPGGPPAEEESAKRARVEDAKKQRINAIKREYESRLTAVKFKYSEYFTMDDYTADLNVDEDYNPEDELWSGEDEISFSDVPEALWSDHPTDSMPNFDPEGWVDDLADKVEINRLLKMGVLVLANEFQCEITGKLTTKFVRDWRLKDYDDGSGKCNKRWMRRSRYVAREFANTKRTDTFSPATGAHTSNLLQLKYLAMKQSAKDMDVSYQPVLGCLDVKEPILVQLQGESYVIRQNLPGQRLGAKQWYLHLSKFLNAQMDFTFCAEQPCIARNDFATLIIQVDDVLYCGNKDYWENVFLAKMKSEFTVSHSQFSGPGSSLTFLKRQIKEVENGLLLIPGTNVEKVITAFEKSYGVARKQTIPCDNSVQLEDQSQPLNARDASAYRSIVGLCLYISRERPDMMFGIKELASRMSSPTLSAVQRLRKLVGYMKHVGDVAVLLEAMDVVQRMLILSGCLKRIQTLTGVPTNHIDVLPPVVCIS